MTPLQKRLAELRRIASPQMPASIDRECHIAHALLALIPVVEAALAWSASDDERAATLALGRALDECECALADTKTKEPKP